MWPSLAGECEGGRAQRRVGGVGSVGSVGCVVAGGRGAVRLHVPVLAPLLRLLLQHELLQGHEPHQILRLKCDTTCYSNKKIFIQNCLIRIRHLLLYIFTVFYTI